MAKKNTVEVTHVVADELHGMHPFENLFDILQYELGDADLGWIKKHKGKASQAIIMQLETDGPTYVTLLDDKGLVLETDVYPIT